MNPKDILVDPKNLFVGLIIFVAVLTGLAATAYSSVENSSQVNNYSTEANVTSLGGQNATLGIDTGNEMSFGKVIEGSNVTKTLELSSQDLTLVESSASGNISDNLYFEKKTLFRNDTDIEYMYAGTESGYYDGEILLEIKTADNYWGEKWLELLYRLPF